MTIRITIEQLGREIYTVKENVVVKETPTTITENSYGNKEVKFEREFAVQDVQKVNNWTREVLRQDIQDETQFDLAKVIKAINNL